MVIIFLGTLLPISVSAVDDLITNGTFEALGTNNLPTGWGVYSQRKAIVEYSTEEAYEGNSSLKISTGEANVALSLAASFQYINNIDEGAEYEVSAYVKNIDATRVYFKLSPYKDSVSMPEINSGSLPVVTGVWTKVSFAFTAPAGCNKVLLILRQGSAGTTYWDNASFIKTREAPTFFLETDEVFYYTEWGTGKASVQISSKNSSLFGSEITFEIYDGTNRIAKSFINTDQEGKAEWNFAVTRLLNIGIRYTLCATLGEDTLALPVYRYNRPTALREDGVYLKKGEPFIPKFVMGVTSLDEFERAKAMGFNAVTVSMFAVDSFIEYARNNDMMLMPALYPYMEPAGSARNENGTKLVVDKYKEDPNILCWSIMDEPALYPGVCTDEAMINSYKIIRDIDQMHPVSATEALWTDYSWTFRYTDILMPDSYPAGTQNPATHIKNMAAKAEEYSKGRKPYIFVLQSFRYVTWFPDDNEIVNMAAQALTGGCSGVGFYRFQNAADGKDLDETEICDAVTRFNKNEAEILSNHFILGNGSDLSFGDNYKLWADNGSIFALVMNQSSVNSDTASISITGAGNDKIKIVGGGTIDEANFLNGILTVNLAPSQTVLYKILPPPAGNSISFCKGNFITDALEEGDFTASYHYVAEKKSSVLAVVALFSDFDGIRKLESVKVYETEEFSEGQTYDFDVPVRINAMGDGSFVLKALLWDSLFMQTPLAEPEEINR